MGREDFIYKLLFKKRMFRESDETILEPMFISLSYLQAQHDYLQADFYPLLAKYARLTNPLLRYPLK